MSSWLARHLTTRRGLIDAGVGAASFASSASFASAASAATDLEFIAARFDEATGPRSAVVSPPVEPPISIALEPSARISHGTEGKVDSLDYFVPDEQVVVRGTRTAAGFTAMDLHSLYRSVTGKLGADATTYWLNLPSGRRAAISDQVSQRFLQGDVRPGRTYKALIWTDPRTGRASAVSLRS